MIARSRTQPKHRFHFTPNLSALKPLSKKVNLTFDCTAAQRSKSEAGRCLSEDLSLCSRLLHLDVRHSFLERHFIIGRGITKGIVDTLVDPRIIPLVTSIYTKLAFFKNLE